VIREARLDDGEEFQRSKMGRKVYNPDIVSKSEKLYKKPGYTT